MATDAEITKFSLEIDKIVKSKSIPYIDAIVLYCQQTGLEVEFSAQLISTSIRSKIRKEAEELRLLPKPKSKKLPIRKENVEPIFQQ